MPSSGPSPEPSPEPTRIVGVIPAAGRATRLGALPLSKELLPVGWRLEGGERLPKVVSQYLIEKMQAAGASRIYIVVRRGKWDIADYFGDGSRLGLSIAYLLVDEPYGPPFTANQAAPFVDDAIVLFGFPDILLQPANVFSLAVGRLRASKADIVIGTFPARHGDSVDSVETAPGGRVLRLVPKEDPDHARRAAYHPTYMFAVWRPSFTAFLSADVKRLRAIAHAQGAGSLPEWPVGTVIASAIAAGLHVDSMFYDNGRFLDIGTPDRLAAARAKPEAWDG
ncbi:MAG: dTDP-glucose pyrophosphorylase [Burkholderiales bacterium]|nr:dTDP-glucose pyrophosphorylase [Burkholderiales bacterium]